MYGHLHNKHSLIYSNVMLLRQSLNYKADLGVLIVQLTDINVSCVKLLVQCGFGKFFPSQLKHKMKLCIIGLFSYLCVSMFQS